MAGEYQVLAIRYGTLSRLYGDAFMVRDTSVPLDVHYKPVPIDYYIWLVRNGDRTILVDTGFDFPAAKQRGRTMLAHPAERLKALDIDPARITDVVITHLHYDHAGNLASFPNAVFHLQDAEMAYATGRLMTNHLFGHPFDVEDVTAMVRNVFAGRVRFHNGDAEIAPGLSLHPVPGHTKGLQCVRAATGRGAVVLASDSFALYDNLETGVPSPLLVSLEDVVQSWDRLGELADSPDHLIPGHDPRVRAIYPRLNANNEDVVVLSEAPKK